MKYVIRAPSRRSGIRGAFPIALCGLLAVSAACEDDDDPMGPDDDVASVQFATDTQTIEVGSTHQLTFEIRDDAGNLIDPDDVTIDFSSNTVTVATVSETGLVTPVAAGTAVITIEVGSVSDTITITVTPEISSIDIVLADIDLVSAETATLEVTVLDMAGDPVPDPGLTFTSSNEAVATVNDDGVVTAVSAGTATITAEGGDDSDSIEVTVFAAASGGVSLGGNSFTVMLGDAVTINDLVVVRDAGGVIIPDAELAFESLDETVVTVDAAGLLTALAVGDALITVTSPDAPLGSATFRLSVLAAGSVDEITLDPATATVAVAATVDLDVVAEADGEPIDDFLAVFTSSDETVAVVDPFTGEVTGVAVGMATITATNGALTAESVITVQ
jgi:uncharacterized protein YjdB